ncbi:MAG: hypothetical protein AVDCRST_MAG53-2392, partial [uncultured Solirubrobacteraceae bacterium]
WTTTRSASWSSASPGAGPRAARRSSARRCWPRALTSARSRPGSCARAAPRRPRSPRRAPGSTPTGSPSARRRGPRRRCATSCRPGRWTA